jgi:hypothetical protein
MDSMQVGKMLSPEGQASLQTLKEQNKDEDFSRGVSRYT